MKTRISWILLLWTAYLILLISDWKNLKYFPRLIEELKKTIHKNSKYTEDNDFVLMKRPRKKEL
jgi:hypothetical protein